MRRSFMVGDPRFPEDAVNLRTLDEKAKTIVTDDNGKASIKMISLDTHGLSGVSFTKIATRGPGAICSFYISIVGASSSSAGALHGNSILDFEYSKVGSADANVTHSRIGDSQPGFNANVNVVQAPDGTVEFWIREEYGSSSCGIHIRRSIGINVIENPTSTKTSPAGTDLYVMGVSPNKKTIEIETVSCALIGAKEVRSNKGTFYGSVSITTDATYGSGPNATFTMGSLNQNSVDSGKAYAYEFYLSGAQTGYGLCIQSKNRGVADSVIAQFTNTGFHVWGKVSSSATVDDINNGTLDTLTTKDWVSRRILITGYAEKTGAIVANDKLQTAIEKTNGRISSLFNGVEFVFGISGSVATNVVMCASGSNPSDKQASLYWISAGGVASAEITTDALGSDALGDVIVKVSTVKLRIKKDGTIVAPDSVSATVLSNSKNLVTVESVSGVLLTGYAPLSGVVSATDTLLVAIGKLSGTKLQKFSSVAQIPLVTGIRGDSGAVSIYESIFEPNTTGFVPFIGGSTVIRSIGYIQQVSFGAYRGSNSWAGSGAYIAIGGDYNANECWVFRAGGEIFHSSGLTVAYNGALATTETLVSFNSKAGAIAGTDTIRTAIEKLNGNKANAAHNHSEVQGNDLRSTNITPYYKSYTSITQSLMNNTTDGLSDGGTLHDIIHINRWTDITGGACAQLAFTDAGRMWMRSGINSWNSWSRFAFIQEVQPINANLTTFGSAFSVTESPSFKQLSGTTKLTALHSNTSIALLASNWTYVTDVQGKNDASKFSSLVTCGGAASPDDSFSVYTAPPSGAITQVFGCGTSGDVYMGSASKSLMTKFTGNSINLRALALSDSSWVGGFSDSSEAYVYSGVNTYYQNNQFKRIKSNSHTGLTILNGNAFSIYFSTALGAAGSESGISEMVKLSRTGQSGITSAGVAYSSLWNGTATGLATSGTTWIGTDGGANSNTIIASNSYIASSEWRNASDTATPSLMVMDAGGLTFYMGSVDVKGTNSGFISMLNVNSAGVVRSAGSVGDILAAPTGLITVNAMKSMQLGGFSAKTGVVVAADTYLSGIEKLQGSKLNLSGGGMSGGIRTPYVGASVSNGKFYSHVEGGFFRTTSDVYTGAINITLPHAASEGMITFWVDVFNYVTETSFSLFVCLYSYTGGVPYNVSAKCIGANHLVTFGINSLSIGSAGTTWSYPQVTIRDVSVGYSGGNLSWATGWGINISTNVPTPYLSISDADVVKGAKVTGYTSRTGAISGSDTFQMAIEKLDGNKAALVHTHSVADWSNKGLSPQITSGSFNSIIKTGLYAVNGLADGPNNQWWHLMVEAQGAGWVRQTVASLGTGANVSMFHETYIRNYVNGTWSSWVKVLGGYMPYTSGQPIPAGDFEVFIECTGGRNVSLGTTIVGTKEYGRDDTGVFEGSIVYETGLSTHSGPNGYFKLRIRRINSYYEVSMYNYHTVSSRIIKTSTEIGSGLIASGSPALTAITFSGATSVGKICYL